MKNLVFAIVVIGIVAFLYVLSTKNVVPIPADAAHASISEEAGCFSCHGEGKEFARKKDHPPKDHCFKCHERSEEKSKAQE